jgi:hypothetical protein
MSHWARISIRLRYECAERLQQRAHSVLRSSCEARPNTGARVANAFRLYRLKNGEKVAARFYRFRFLLKVISLWGFEWGGHTKREPLIILPALPRLLSGCFRADHPEFRANGVQQVLSPLNALLGCSVFPLVGSSNHLRHRVVQQVLD